MASGKRFKGLLVDIGLMHHLLGLPLSEDYLDADLLDLFRGAMAEQFVGQELLASQGPELYYWSRSARTSTAEVDFLAVRKGEVHPVEVKSGAAGRLRSLHRCLEENPNCPSGWVFSTRPFAELPAQRLTFLPIYFAYSAPRDPTTRPVI